MAGIDLECVTSGRRASNHELPLVPFIDFLLCLVAFLLVTAVWTQMARLSVNALVPGRAEDPASTDPAERVLHVETRGSKQFQLVWKEGGTVVNTIAVGRKAVGIGIGEDYRYPELAERVTAEWKANGVHRSMADQRLDKAVIHTDNETPFSDIVAIIDAVYSPERELAVGRGFSLVPAFDVTFAVN